MQLSDHLRSLRDICCLCMRTECIGAVVVTTSVPYPVMALMVIESLVWGGLSLRVPSQKYLNQRYNVWRTHGSVLVWPWDGRMINGARVRYNQDCSKWSTIRLQRPLQLVHGFRGQCDRENVSEIGWRKGHEWNINIQQLIVWVSICIN